MKDFSEGKRMNKKMRQQKEDKVFKSFGQWEKHYLDKDCEAKKREVVERDVVKISTMLANQAIVRLTASKH